MGQDGEFRRVNLAIYLTDKREIDARDELDSRGLVRVILSTGDSQTVDAVLVDGLEARQKPCKVRLDSTDRQHRGP